jgi:Icc-related predicted phosphoesterase
MRCLFASDLHGKRARYEALFAALRDAPPDALLLGGDLLPGFAGLGGDSELLDFLGPEGYLSRQLRQLREALGRDYPRVLAIFGNDDPRAELPALEALADEGLIEHVHGRRVRLGEHPLYGYAFSPPSPFPLKDWERYDVSRYVDPGCTAPTEGRLSVSVDERELTWTTIADDLEQLAGDEEEMARAIFLFHAPPYQTALDRADLDGKSVEHVPLDVNVGSIAMRRFIEAHEPLLTLHGHIHESARLTGRWSDQLGRTTLLSAAHDGPELALIDFDTDDLGNARRDLR